jgi:Rho GDP-dissociation inhibitor
LKASIA